MGASKSLFIRMQEDEYLAIPSHIRASHLASKVYRETPNDFDDLISDELYASLYKQKKEISKQLDEREYQIRENKRKQLNK